MNVDFEEQMKLYDSFESNVFFEIWSFCKTTKMKDIKTYKGLCANGNGKYINFLTDIGKRNGVLESYKNSILNAGDFTDIYRLEHQIFNKSKRIDLDDPAIQIIIAVDYLTQNDQEKRMELWKVE